ncbi:MAG: hypothetical protein ACJAUZ_002546 [Flavobacteriaceae bacterium]
MVSESIAQKAGLRAGTVPSQIGEQKLRLGGDVILEINGLVCRSPHDFQALNENTPILTTDNAY